MNTNSKMLSTSRRQDLEAGRIMWLAGALITVMVTCVAAQGTHTTVPWELRKYHHQSRSFTNTRMVTLSSLSDSDRMRRVELEPLLQQRVPGTPGIRRVREHLLKRLEDLDFEVEIDRFNDRAPSGESIEFVNIVATSNPTAVRRLVLACHYDSKNDTGFIGATDSSVPCAMLLDLAYTLKPYLSKSKDSERDLTLQLIFFDGEEAFERWTDTDSLYGARHLASLMEGTNYPAADSHTNMLDSIDLFVLLDLLGTQDCRIMSMFDNTKREFERLMRIESKLHKADQLSGNTRIFRNERSFHYGGVEDDHIPFYNRGVRILHLVPVPFPRVWHTQHDNEQALHYPSIDNISKVLRVFVAEYLHLPV